MSYSMYGASPESLGCSCPPTASSILSEYTTKMNTILRSLNSKTTQSQKAAALDKLAVLIAMMDLSIAAAAKATS